MWEKCRRCDRPRVCDSNTKKIRLIGVGGVVGGGLLGALALPLFGFGAGGVAAGSFAASWQSSIGIVAAGTLFATLQSLGATGLGVLMFGGLGAATGLLGTLAARLNWCKDDCDYNDQKFEWEKCSECKKPRVSESNLLKLRALAASGFLRGSPEAAEMLPFIRLLGEHDVTIDSSAANRLFTAIQSLEEAGLSVILFGDIRSGLILLAAMGPKLHWCRNDCTTNNDYNNGNNALMPTEKIIASSEIVLTNSLVPVSNLSNYLLHCDLNSTLKKTF